MNTAFPIILERLGNVRQDGDGELPFQPNTLLSGVGELSDPVRCGVTGGRGWDRTSDILRVKQALSR